MTQRGIRFIPMAVNLLTVLVVPSIIQNASGAACKKAGFKRRAASIRSFLSYLEAREGFNWAYDTMYLGYINLFLTCIFFDAICPCGASRYRIHTVDCLFLYSKLQMCLTNNKWYQEYLVAEWVLYSLISSWLLNSPRNLSSWSVSLCEYCLLL